VEVGGSKSVVFCGGSTYKVCMCFDRFCFFTGFGESQYDAILSQGMFYLRVGLGPVALGPPNTDRASSPINSPGVGTGLGTLNNGY
jgi:hypothetical protein